MIQTWTTRRQQQQQKPRNAAIKSAPHSTSRRPCARCPNADQIVIAQRRLDGVLIEPPVPQPCDATAPSQSVAIVQARYRLQTLMAPYKFALPAGEHSIYARLINRKTGLDEQMCRLRYTVIVRQCADYRPRDQFVRVRCDLGNVWGSRCQLTCRGNKVMSQVPATTVYCNDDLEWTGDEPQCKGIF